MNNMLDELIEDELIQKIADPILDRLLDLQEELGEEAFSKPIKIQIASPDLDDSMIPSDGSDINKAAQRAFLEKLECYLQEQLDEWTRPTILH